MHCLRNTAILLLGISFFFNACINLKQPSLEIQYYTLEYEPPHAADLQPLPVVIRVDRFSVAPVFNTKRIIYREQAFKREAYAYHKWQANPGDLVSYFLTRDIQQSGLCKAVLSYCSSVPSSYSLDGAIDEFLEWDGEETWKAVLAVSVTFVAENESEVSKRTLFQKAYRFDETCDQKNPRAVAVAMSRAMARLSGEIIKDIYSVLSP